MHLKKVRVPTNIHTQVRTSLGRLILAYENCIRFLYCAITTAIYWSVKKPSRPRSSIHRKREPVLRRIEQEKVEPAAILNTHHHRDHTGGNEELLAQHKVDVYGHRSDSARIAGFDARRRGRR